VVSILTSPSKRKNQMQRRSPLKTILCCSLVVGHLLPTKDKTLLYRRDTLFFLDFFFDLRDLVLGLDVQLDLLAGQCSDLDEHDCGFGLVQWWMKGPVLGMLLEVEVEPA